MLNVASQKPGVTALDFMLDNYYPIFNKDFEDGIEWVNTIKNQAEANNLELQIGRSNLCLGTIHYLNGDYELAITHYQTALDQFEDEKRSPPIRVRIIFFSNYLLLAS